MLKSVFAVMLILMLSATAFALEAQVLPESVYPGDAFMVRVRGADAKPLGVYHGGWLNFAPCGEGCYEAIAAIDLGDKPGEKKISINAFEDNKDILLMVLPKEFPVTHLTLQPGKVTLSPEDEARAERETEMLKKLWKTVTAKSWKGEFAMPLDNSFSTAFGVKRIMNNVKTSVHTGLDIRGRTGEPVRATNSGTVVVAQELFYGGNTLVLDHGQGIYSYYMHLSKFMANVGDVVKKGDVVGEVGMTGRATGPHLHFGVKISETNANPLSVTKLPL
jgi:hypothetical protein